MWSNLIYLHDTFYIIVCFIVLLRTGAQTGYCLTVQSQDLELTTLKQKKASIHLYNKKGNHDKSRSKPRELSMWQVDLGWQLYFFI